MDPQKMQAYVDSRRKGSGEAKGPPGKSHDKRLPPAPANERGGKPKPKQQFGGKNNPKNAPPGQGDEDHKEGGEGRFGALIPLLEASASDIEGMTDELDVDLLQDPEQEMDGENARLLHEGFESLPDELRSALEGSVGGMSMEDAIQLADHLHDEDMISDPQVVAGWLFRLGQVL